MFEGIVEWLTGALAVWGPQARAASLYLIGIADSSLLSLPEINDLLLLYVCTVSTAHAPLFAIASTLGSATGCFLLHALARWKGPAYLERTFPEGRIRSSLRLYQRYGAWTLVVPALLPPPCPFKIFVLSSGAFGLPLSRFALAILLGRGVRYGLGAFLAVRYGEQALTLIQSRPLLFVGLALLIVLLTVAVLTFIGRRLNQDSLERSLV